MFLKNKSLTTRVILILFFATAFIVPIQTKADNNSVTLTNLVLPTNNRIKQNSSPQSIFQINIAGKNKRKLTSIITKITGSGFSNSDLKSITNNSSSGVLIYEESESIPNGLDSSDKLIKLDSSSGWFSENDLYLFLKKPKKINKNSTFYIAIQTSTVSTNDHQIQITIPSGGVTLSDNEIKPINNISSGIVTIDSIRPIIEKATLVNPISVDVKFSEPVNENLAKTIENYTFNNKLTIGQINKISNDIYRVISETIIPTASTTLRISANITDIAGNDGIDTIELVTRPSNIHFSEIATKINENGWAEFIELYNSGNESVDISGWKIEYSKYNSKNWKTKVTFPTNTHIAPYSFYLITSKKYYESGVCPDTPLDLCKSRIGLPNSGGHLRLFTGTKEVDRIGWGNAIYAETLPASSLKNNESLERKAFGTSNFLDMTDGKDRSMGNSWDSDNNYLDFIKRKVIDPQNSNSGNEQPSLTNYPGTAAKGPTINHVPLNIVPINSDLNIFVQAGDPRTATQNISTEIHYSIGSENNYISHNEPRHYHLIGTPISNGYFKFTIPQSQISNSNALTHGILYHLQILTNNGASQLSSNPLAITHEEARQSPFVLKPEDSSTWTTYQISGTITNDQASGIEDALVFAKGTGFSTTTNSNGEYSLRQHWQRNHSYRQLRSNNNQPK